MNGEEQKSFEEVKTRLDEIVTVVSDDAISLDQALDLYEEAIKLGMQVSAQLEVGISDEQVEEAVSEMESNEHAAFEQEVEVDLESEVGMHE